MRGRDDLARLLHEPRRRDEEVERGLVRAEVDRDQVAVEARRVTHEAEDALVQADRRELAEADRGLGAQGRQHVVDLQVGDANTMSLLGLKHTYTIRVYIQTVENNTQNILEKEWLQGRDMSIIQKN